jgi:hypothetical protein
MPPQYAIQMLSADAGDEKANDKSVEVSCSKTEINRNNVLYRTQKKSNTTPQWKQQQHHIQKS